MTALIGSALFIFSIYQSVGKKSNQNRHFFCSMPEIATSHKVVLPGRPIAVVMYTSLHRAFPLRKKILPGVRLSPKLTQK